MRVELTYDRGIEAFDTRLNGDADLVRATLAMRVKTDGNGEPERLALCIRSRIKVAEYAKDGKRSDQRTEDSSWSVLAQISSADVQAAGLPMPMTFIDLLDLMGSLGVEVERGGGRWHLLRCDVDGGNIWTAPIDETDEGDEADEKIEN